MANIFVYPSLYENFGQPLIEAAAHGLPLISTPVGIARDIIIDGEGVIGENPTIKPGDSFIYSSGCLITSPVGAMRGFYNMININNGKKFRAYIPTFKLNAPQALN